MKPYITRLMKEAHEKGTPVMRPLFYDFPEDSGSWECEDQYLFGPDVGSAGDVRENREQRGISAWRGKLGEFLDRREL